MVGYIIKGSRSGRCRYNDGSIPELALPVVKRFDCDIISMAPVHLDDAGLPVVAFLDDSPPVFLEELD